MAWIESHQTLRDHPKTRKLARLLDISRPQAIGHLQCLWWWAMDYAEDGCLDRFDAMDIALGAEWEEAPDAFLDALIQVGFLDQTPSGVVIHDWHDYAGKLIERRKANAERMREARAKRERTASNERAAHVQRTQRARAELPNQTQPDTTLPGVNPPGPLVEKAADAARLSPPSPSPPPGQEAPKPRSARQKASDDAHARRTALFAAWCRGVGLDPDSDEARVGRDVAFRQLKTVVAAPVPSAVDFEACTRYLASQDWRDDPPTIPAVIRGYGTWAAQGKPAAATGRSPTSIRRGEGRPSPNKRGGYTSGELIQMAREEYKREPS